MTETMDKVTVESGKYFLCPHCQYPFNGTEEVGARVIRCLDKDCDMQFVLDVLAPEPHENVPLEDMCGILKPRDTLVETVAIYLWWNWIDSNKSLDEEKEEHWSYVREESKVVTRKRARELLSKLPLDEIRGLAKGIERDNHHGGIVKSHAREIIALCGEPSEPDTMWDEINTVIVDEFRKKFSDQWCTGYANELTDRIMAIIDKERKS
jgi:hypothetical protein